MNALRTILISLVAIPLTARATSYSFVDLEEYLKDARVVAHVEVIGSVPERILPSVDIACGATVTARVVESFWGATTGSIIRFESEGMTVGAQYVVALGTYNPNAIGGNNVLVMTAEMSNEQAEEMALACKKRLPEMSSWWRVTSEIVASRWVSWGYNINLPPRSAGLTFIGRKSERTIEVFAYSGKNRMVVKKTASFSNDDPDYGQIVASRFSFPEMYVEWPGYRSYLLKISQ